MLLASPKVLSSKDIAKSPVDFKMYDAIPAAQQSLSTDDSSEVNKFLPMLNDYLKSEVANITSFGTAFNERIVHDIDIGSEMNPPAVKKPSGVIGQPTSLQSALDGDYVWDVFYHRPATLSEWNEAANVGTLWVSSFPLTSNLFTSLPYSGLDFHLRSELFTILPRMRKKRKMKQMKTLTVSGSIISGLCYL